MKGTLALVALVGFATQQHVMAKDIFACSDFNAAFLQNRDMGPFCGEIRCENGPVGSTTIPAELGTVQIIDTSKCEETFFPFLDVTIVNASPKLSGQIPASLSALTIPHWLSFSDNTISGSIPMEVRSNQFLMGVDVEKNQLGGTIADHLAGWSSNLTSLKLQENNISGNYNDTALFDFLVNAEKLVTFSLSLINRDHDGCMRVPDIHKERKNAGRSELSNILVPVEFICAATTTTSPTITGFTAAPSSPTESPTKFPTFEAGPEPTKGPTPEPTPSPTPPFPTNRPTTVPPRTLPPTNAAPTLRLSIISICIAAIFFAMTRQ